MQAAASKSKPDCTGQRFGRLLVLGKGDRVPDNRGSYIQLWKLQCDCGQLIQRPRSSFEDKNQISCGCARKLGLIDNKRRPTDIAGQRFGSLEAIALTGKKDKHNQPTWLLRCDCGNTCKFSLKYLTHKKHTCLWINCGDRSKHPEFSCWYPPTPSPYPVDAGRLLEKYLRLAGLPYKIIDSRVEDERRDRLIRACWIITYRRSQGEQISEFYEKRYIKKHLKYCSIDVFWRRKLEANGGFLYTVGNKKKEIGAAMTNETSLDYPEIELEGINLLSTNNPLPPKRLKFRRC
ncbi:hypothetical protein ACX27_04210 [Nostoc piscinale CENA21]|uniref:Uncharacterized protein n=1 Tax=Nostoc piscinale CENA21 TaxID=224013 RepID=A0A0M4SUX4_9NOSO|nr:hypothetical protein ACX27_04210 [Nostoc piscinale CENA21]